MNPREQVTGESSAPWLETKGDQMIEISEPRKRKECPWCAETILEKAIVCRCCGRDVPAGAGNSGPQGGHPDHSTAGSVLSATRHEDPPLITDDEQDALKLMASTFSVQTDSRTAAQNERARCAYCGLMGKQTKEHIFPKFLYRQFPDNKTGYNMRADKFMKWESQVRDVCETCNNGPLSVLDSYANTFLSTLKPARTFEKSAIVQVDYDYDKLLRWLLKVSYNSARAMSSVPQVLQQSVSYILDGSSEAPAVGFCSIEIVRDAPIAEAERSNLPEDAKSWRFLPASMFRAGSIMIDPRFAEDIPEGCIIRSVAINSWYFAVCLVPRDTDRPTRRRVASLWKRAIPDAVFLSPARNSVSVSVSRRTCLDAFADQGKMTMKKWLDHSGRAS